MAKLVPDPESSTPALVLPATRHCESSVWKTLLRLYCVAGFMQGSLLWCCRTTKYSTPSSNPAPEVSQAPNMVPELVLVAEISRFSLSSYSCLGNLHLPAFSQWGASSLGDFSPTSASFDTALDAATHLHHGLLDRTLHAFTLSLCGILCPNYWSSRPCTRCRQARPPITRRYIV